MWTQLKSFHLEYLSEIQAVNQNQFSVIPSRWSYKQSDGIYIYSISANDWSLFMEYDKDFKSTDCATCIDIDNKEYLYLANNQSQLLQFDLSSLSSYKQLSNSHNFAGSKMLCINNNIHIIGGNNGHNHYRFDLKTNKLTLIHTFIDDHTSENGINFKFSDKFIGHNILYLKHENCILLFVSERNTAIYKYSLVNNNNDESKWKKLDNISSIPKDIRHSSVLLTKDSKYAILFVMETYGFLMLNICILN